MNMPCSNTAALDQYEIEQDRLERIQDAKDALIQSRMIQFEEDTPEFIQYLSELELEQFVTDLIEITKVDETQEERFALITDEITNKYRVIAERLVDSVC